jgi:prepilin-type N-terminal cleavage/methylation domain-containing protein
MKRAFTLIELIFVIVIIGLLAAVAVPKFLNLKQNAEANSIVKTTVDAAQQAVETAINHRDLENETFGTDFNLTDLVSLKGKGWVNGPLENNSYDYNITYNNSQLNVAEINMSSSEVNYTINCKAFNSANDATTYNKCKALIGNQDSISVSLSW